MLYIGFVIFLLVITRRGDMEILGFNLLHWVTSSLPWENDISHPKAVEAKKNEVMSSVSSYFKNKNSVPTGKKCILKFDAYQL